MIALRAARSEDAAAIAAIYAPHVLVGTASFEREPPDEGAMRRRMEASAGLYPWIVATISEGGGDVLAYAYAAAFNPREAYRWTAETTIYVADTAQRQGAGRLLYGALIATLRAQGFAQAIARIALPNLASVALHEATGFRRAGITQAVGFKHGRWIDVGLWQRGLAPRQALPAEPRSLDDTGIVRG